MPDFAEEAAGPGRTLAAGAAAGIRGWAAPEPPGAGEGRAARRPAEPARDSGTRESSYSYYCAAISKVLSPSRHVFESHPSVYPDELQARPGPGRTRVSLPGAELTDAECNAGDSQRRTAGNRNWRFQVFGARQRELVKDWVCLSLRPFFWSFLSIMALNLHFNLTDPVSFNCAAIGGLLREHMQDMFS